MAPGARGGVQGGAERGPLLDQLNFVNEARAMRSLHLSPCPLPQRRGRSGLLARGGFVEFFLGDVQQLGKVDLRALFAEEVAVQDQFAGVAFFLQHALEFAVDAAFADDGPTLTGQRELSRWTRLMACSNLSQAQE